MTPQTPIVVGQIAGAFGVRGEVRLKSFCAQPEAIAAYAPLTTASGRVFARIRLTGQTSGAFTARLDGITAKEEADALKGTDLLAPRDRLPSLPDDEFYHADLIGLDVVDTGGAAMGRVRAVLNHGAGDILDIAGGAAELLVPFTREAVPVVDLGARRVVIDPPADA